MRPASCPLGNYLVAAQSALGGAAYRLAADAVLARFERRALVAGTVLGVLLGLLVILDRWTRPALIGLFALYLSYVYAGQDFLNFQWDALLLEAGFLAIFLTGGSRIVVWLYRWLVFRYLFLAGAAKLALRRRHVARRHGARVSLLDATAAHPARLVCGELPRWLLHRRSRRCPGGRSRMRVSDFPATPPARRGGMAAHCCFNP